MPRLWRKKKTKTTIEMEEKEKAERLTTKYGKLEENFSLYKEVIDKLIEK